MRANKGLIKVIFGIWAFLGSLWWIMTYNPFNWGVVILSVGGMFCGLLTYLDGLTDMGYFKKVMPDA